MSRLALAVVFVCSSGCLAPFDITGPYACAADGTCSNGLTCDNGVCCKPGGTPACPTLPIDGTCPTGAPQRFYRDDDGDGFGTGSVRLFCALPQREPWAREVLDAGRVVLDCNDDADGGAAISPSARERCNGLDDDCNGLVDEGLLPRTAWYRDVDSDGFGSDAPGDVGLACAQPPGFAARAGDCDSTSNTRFPGAPERCNNVDDNCNGVVDEPPLADAESAGFTMRVDCSAGQGVCAMGGRECLRNAVSQLNELVCVPRTRASMERCDGLDNDCDGVVDEPPGCGGPTGFLTTPRVQFGASRVAAPVTTQPSRLTPTCLARQTGFEAQGWLAPAWVGAHAETMSGVPIRHTWFAEAEPGTTWDLSRRTSVSLALFDRSELGTNLFSTAHFPGPVVTLCGERDGDYLRLSPSTNQLAQGGSVSAELAFDGSTPGWTRERTSAFDLARVKRIEVTVGPVPVMNPGPFDVKTLTIVVSPDAGFTR